MPAAAEPTPRRRDLRGRRQLRIIPSRIPPIDLFETLVPADDLPVLHALEALTHDRLRAETGELPRLPPEEWVTGPGASVVMAPFVYLGVPSRFGDGSFGVYYAALDEDTAIAETVFHRERFLAATAEPPIELEMRCHVGTVETRLEDVRGPRFAHLQSPDLARWPVPQAFGAARRSAGAEGLNYRSARNPCGECIAVFRPKAVSLPVQGPHYRYVWDGARISQVLTVSEVRQLDR